MTGGIANVLAGTRPLLVALCGRILRDHDAFKLFEQEDHSTSSASLLMLPTGAYLSTLAELLHVLRMLAHISTYIAERQIHSQIPYEIDQVRHALIPNLIIPYATSALHDRLILQVHTEEAQDKKSLLSGIHPH